MRRSFSRSSSFAAWRSCSPSSWSTPSGTRSALVRPDQRSRLNRALLRKFGAQIGLRQQRRAERQACGHLAAFDEQRQLAERHLVTARRFRPLPRRAELALLQPLREQAHPRAVEIEHLCPPTIAPHEQEQVSRQNLALHPLGHQRRQRVKRLAHVARLVEGIHGDPARQPDHASLRSSSAIPARSKPRTRTRPHSTTTSATVVGPAAIVTGTSCPRRRAAARQYCKVARLIPSSKAIRASLWPSALAVLACASTASRRSVG